MIPADDLTEMGLTAGQDVFVAYITDDGLANRYHEFTVSSVSLSELDTAQQIAIPQQLLEQAGIDSNAEVQITCMDGTIIITGDTPLTEDELSVAENIYLNKQFKQPGTNIVDWSRTYEEAGRLIEKLKINIDPYVRCNTLGIAGQQAVQIVKALAQEFEVLILDEPTASFGKAEIDNLFRIINLLRDEGKSIIYISHHIDEVFEIANKITVIRDGEVICTEAASDINKTKLINYMIGREATTIYEKSAYEIGALGFSVQCMSRSNVVKNVSFDVHYTRPGLLSKTFRRFWHPVRTRLSLKKILSVAPPSTDLPVELSITEGGTSDAD